MRRRPRIAAIENAARQALGMPGLVRHASDSTGAALRGETVGRGWAATGTLTAGGAFLHAHDSGIASEAGRIVRLVAAQGKAVASGGRVHVVTGTATVGTTATADVKVIDGDAAIRLAEWDRNSIMFGGFVGATTATIFGQSVIGGTVIGSVIGLVQGRRVWRKLR